MITYNSNKDKKIDFNVGGVSGVRDKFDKGKKIVKKIQNDGLVNTVKNTINNKNSNNTTDNSPKKKVDDAILAYKKNLTNSYEMETEGFKDTANKVITRVKKGLKDFINKPIIEPTINQRDYQQRVNDKTTHKLSQP